MILIRIMPWGEKPKKCSVWGDVPCEALGDVIQQARRETTESPLAFLAGRSFNKHVYQEPSLIKLNVSFLFTELVSCLQTAYGFVSSMH